MTSSFVTVPGNKVDVSKKNYLEIARTPADKVQKAQRKS